MLNILSIYLQAILEEENLYRDYSIHVGKDLFGKWVITTSNGRIGTPGKIRHYAFSSKQELIKILLQIIRKRQNAHKRIGTNYKIISYSCAEELMDPEIFNSLHLSPYLKQ